MISNAINFCAVVIFDLWACTKWKLIHYTVSRLRETRRNSDHVGKISLHSPEEKYFLKLKSEGRSVLKMSWAKEIPKVN